MSIIIVLGAMMVRVVGWDTDPTVAVTVAVPGLRLAVKVVFDPLVALIEEFFPCKLQMVLVGIPLKFTTSPMPMVVRVSSGLPAAVQAVW